MADEEQQQPGGTARQQPAPLPTRRPTKIGRHRAVDLDQEVNEAHLTAILRHLSVDANEG